MIVLDVRWILIETLVMIVVTIEILFQNLWFDSQSIVSRIAYHQNITSLWDWIYWIYYQQCFHFLKAKLNVTISLLTCPCRCWLTLCFLLNKTYKHYKNSSEYTDWFNLDAFRIDQSFFFLVFQFCQICPTLNGVVADYYC